MSRVHLLQDLRLPARRTDPDDDDDDALGKVVEKDVEKELLERAWPELAVRDSDGEFVEQAKKRQLAEVLKFIENADDKRVAYGGTDVVLVPGVCSMPDFDDELFAPRVNGVRSISMLRCEIRQVHHSIAALNNLTDLNLGHNGLRSLPAAVGQLSKLTKLDLSNNAFVEVPACVFELQTLLSLDLSHNGLETVSPDLARLRRLRFLFLPYNSLRTLPDSLSTLENLEVLNLRFNNLRTLPGGFFRLHKLRIFSITDNKDMKKELLDAASAQMIENVRALSAQEQRGAKVKNARFRGPSKK